MAVGTGVLSVGYLALGIGSGTWIREFLCYVLDMGYGDMIPWGRGWRHTLSSFNAFIILFKYHCLLMPTSPYCYV